MSPLLKTIAKTAVAAGAAVGIGMAVDKFAPQKDAAGNLVSYSLIGAKFDTKKLLTVAGLVGAGGAAVYYLAKILKINFLK